MTSELDTRLLAQRRAQASDGPPSAEVRMDRIARLIAAVSGNAERLAAALEDDYGQRNPVQSFGADITATISALRHSQKRVRKWMVDIPSPAGRALRLAGIRSAIRYQPLGVVGIIAPWNFPIELALHPLGQAFAAGNRAMLKVSEVTPKTSRLLCEILEAAFDPTELVVVEGGPEVAAAFARLPFDHIFFTGSTSTGRKVLEAAATNLTPVTLELGGQSPVVIDERVPFERVAKALLLGKTMNAGQYCVAPDHVFVPKRRVGGFIEAMQTAARKCFPAGLGEDATAIIDERHSARLSAICEDAVAKGASVIPLLEVTAPPSSRVMAPTLLLDVDDTMAIWHEEVFSPLLPIYAYETIDEVIARINVGGRPLAAYWFGGDSAERRDFINLTVSGAVTINDIMLHVGLERMPFGGVGASGMGRYHGRAGFKTFSHAKGIVEVPQSFTRFALPPYPGFADRMLRWHSGWAAHAAKRDSRLPERRAGSTGGACT